MLRYRCALLLSVGICSVFSGCAGPYPGPDKQFAGTFEGAAMGAGTGMVTGFQLGSGTGPGAAVGAGLGALAGGIQGIAADQTEEGGLAISAKSRAARERAYAQEVIADNFKRRVELHPTRDIYPADIFFQGDEAKLSSASRAIVSEICRLNENRTPWSRFAVRSYVKSSEPESPYALRLANERARVIGDLLVGAGMEPRRIVAQGIVVSAPVLVDPNDDPLRYSQAIEFTPLDR